MYSKVPRRRMTSIRVLRRRQRLEAEINEAACQRYLHVRTALDNGETITLDYRDTVFGRKIEAGVVRRLTAPRGPRMRGLDFSVQLGEDTITYGPPGFFGYEYTVVQLPDTVKKVA